MFALQYERQWSWSRLLHLFVSLVCEGTLVFWKRFKLHECGFKVRRTSSLQSNPVYMFYSIYGIVSFSSHWKLQEYMRYVQGPRSRHGKKGSWTSKDSSFQKRVWISVADVQQRHLLPSLAFKPNQRCFCSQNLSTSTGVPHYLEQQMHATRLLFHDLRVSHKNVVFGSQRTRYSLSVALTGRHT